MVFYRKYRPQTISELDSEAVRNSLYSIFAKKEFPHAFLFSGPKGLGKTSTARIVAKVINCQKHKDLKNPTQKDIEPCNKCIECTTITNGNNFDVIEIDGASNRGIDEIRDLKEKINLLPTKATKKVYIIDEVHMLTTEAFNALLKTLEEPPAHVVFILCTTEFHKLPQTIVSRCFRVDFKKATNEEIARSLKRIVKAEDIKIDEDVLVDIAKMADGSFRDSTKILEELVISAGDRQVTKKILEEKYNTLGIEENLDLFVQVIKNKDAKKGFEITSKLSQSGMDFKFFIEKLMDRFHLMLLSIHGVGEKSESQFEVIEIKNILEVLGKSYMETKYAVLPQLPLELAIVEWTKEDKPSQELVKPLESKSEEKEKVEDVKPTPVQKTPTTTYKKDDAFYTDFINEVKNHNHLLAGVLRSCEIKEKGDSLEISAISKFHKEKLEEAKSMVILEDVAQKISGKKLSISIILRG